MKFIRQVLTIIWLAAPFFANAGEQLRTQSKPLVDQQTNTNLQQLQGRWEGALAGDTSHGKITITVTGNSLHFHRDKNFWFDTTITVPTGTNPKQLLATIKGCPPAQADSIGKVVGAIFKIEAGTLIIATGGSDSSPEGTPKSFEASESSGLSRYELRKIQPEKQKRTNTSKTTKPER